MVALSSTLEDFCSRREVLNNESIGFVPTMGNLHSGHLSLMNEALNMNEVLVISIFVNPKQFGPQDDFNTYPRTLEEDVLKINEISKKYPGKKVIIFAPQNPQEVFPQGYNQTISVTSLSTDLEGERRPGHFDGVSTVVYRLFEIVRPHNAYFGLKDFQQYHVIKMMVQDLKLPIKIIGMPIIREQEGLALSSRNQYLSNEQLTSSLLIYKNLNKIKEVIHGKKENLSSAQKIIDEMIQDSSWDYIEIRNSEDFSKNLKNTNNVTILAVYKMGTTRLLDNMQVEVM